tara:strand:+ start:813 stop:1106 length:294 start_codon:yes stop_codon:yes gene_type:complete
MNYTVFTFVQPFTVNAVSPQDAALKVATRLASRTIIPHGKPITLFVLLTEDVEWGEGIEQSTRVTVTPLGRTWGSIEERREQREVAAIVNEWTKVVA